jgi:serine/threonine protein kinase
MSSAVYDYIENVTALRNNMYEYKNIKNKKALGRELIKKLREYGCNPDKALYKITNGSSDYGFRLMRVVSNAPLRLKYKSGLTVRDGIGVIGQGAYGMVYIGCIDKGCKKEVAIKFADAKENRLEYNFMKRFEGISPNITHAYYYRQCPKPIKSVLYLEYYSFGSLKRLLGKYGDKLRQLHYRVILFQVIWTLAELHKRFPSFRHNDLHMDNIFIDDRVTTKGSVRYGKFVVPSIGMNAVLGDFGFANMQADGFRNPKVQSGEYKYDYGIATDNNPMYDVHFFLNDLYGTTDNQKVKQFIKRHIPAEYLRSESPVVQNNRLRYGVNHSRLPTFDKILSDKFFRFFSSKGDTVVPPINSFPRNIKIATATKKTPSPAPRVSRKSPIQTLSPTKPVPVKRVVKRPIIPSPKKASPPKFRPENIEKFKAKPEIRPVPTAPAPKSRVVKPQVSPSKVKKTGVVLIKNTVKFVNGSSRGKKCESFKKAEIVAKAKALGITGVDKLSKEKICAMIKNALA